MGRAGRVLTAIASAAVVTVGLAVAIGTSACSELGSPGGSGNTVVDDTRDAEPRPPANPDPPMDAGADVASLYGDASPEGGYFPGINACNGCTCSPDQNYCFGGATPRFAPLPNASDAAAGDAGLPVCAVPDAGARPALGCNKLPAGCTDCACVIALLQPSYACYLVCAFDGTQISAYCPNP